MLNSWQESVQEIPMFLNRGRHPRHCMTIPKVNCFKKLQMAIGKT